MKRIVTLETASELKAVLDALKTALDGEPPHPVLKEAGLYMFWGALTLVLMEGELPLSLHQAKIGKRKKNVWEPYMNWYGAYTLPGARRRGHAYRLYTEAEGIAVRAGCRRVKSLAGSSAGLGLHRALHHQCWGKTENGEVFVDSPLPGHEDKYTGLTPPQAPGARLTGKELDYIMKEGLRYDHAN